MKLEFLCLKSLVYLPQTTESVIQLNFGRWCSLALGSCPGR
jgi:hypothetical protein